MKTKHCCSPQKAQAASGADNSFARPSRTGRWRKLCGCAALLLVVGGAGLFFSLVRIAAKPAPAGASLLAGHSHNGFYFRNKMWLADVKTIAYAVSYLLRPEIVVKTNAVVNG